MTDSRGALFGPYEVDFTRGENSVQLEFLIVFAGTCVCRSNDVGVFSARSVGRMGNVFAGRSSEILRCAQDANIKEWEERIVRAWVEPT